MRVVRLRSVPAPTPDIIDTSDPLAQLMVRTGRGDEQAFAQLYDALAPLVHGIVLRVLRDPSQSDEVTQEVMVELWRLAPRYEASKGSPKSWAATVAHRRAIDRVRAEQSSRERNDKVAAVGSTTTATSLPKRLKPAWKAPVCARLWPASPALSARPSSWHILAAIHIAKVATLLDVAEGTVKTRIRDGLIRLRDELGAAQ